MEKKDLKKTISESKSLNEVLVKLGRNTSSVSYKVLRKYIEEEKIDVSHFLTRKEITNQLLVNGKIKRIENFEMFTENSLVGRSVLKKRIITEKLINYECNFCGNDGNWMGNKITLILDHINGVNNDNRLENLRFLCPNCNSTLPTHCKGYLGLIDKEKIRNEKKEYKPKLKLRKIERPSKETLISEVSEIGYSATGRKYGVSDNAIRQWLKYYNK